MRAGAKMVVSRGRGGLGPGQGSAGAGVSQVGAGRGQVFHCRGRWCKPSISGGRACVGAGVQYSASPPTN